MRQGPGRGAESPSWTENPADLGVRSECVVVDVRVAQGRLRRAAGIARSGRIAAEREPTEPEGPERRGPGAPCSRAAGDPRIGADACEPADHQRVRPSRPPRRQGRPGADRRRRAALRGHRREPRAVDRRPDRPPRRRAQGARRHRPGGAGPGPGDPPADRAPAHPAPLRPRPVPRPHGRATDGAEPVYVGRLGLTDSTGRRLLLDWRSPAAEPFFGATHANPMGLASRRRYRWTRGRITDYWDEVFTAGRARGARRRSTTSPPSSPAWAAAGRPRMRDVLGTIQADQDAIIRAGSRGALVVDGGPGTGQDRRRPAPHRLPPLLRPPPRSPPGRRAVRRTAPALPGLRLRRPPQPRRGGRADLHAAGPRPRGGRGGGRGRPGRGAAEVVGATLVSGDRGGGPVLRGAARQGDDGHDRLGRRPADRRRLGRGLRGAGPRHAAQRGARRRSGRQLLTILVDKHDDDGRRLRTTWSGGRCSRTGSCARPSTARGRCSRRPTSSATCGRCPPTCAGAPPGSTPDDVRALQRADAQAWTVSDLPLLDAARQRLGDPEASRRGAGRRPPSPPSASEMADVVDHLIATDDSRAAGDVDAARARPAGRAGRRRRAAHRRSRPARRAVRARRRRRGAGADRRGVADAAAALPVPQPHHRRGPRPGPARVHGVVAGAAGAGRVRPDRRWRRSASTTGRRRRSWRRPSR